MTKILSIALAIFAFAGIASADPIDLSLNVANESVDSSFSSTSVQLATTSIALMSFADALVPEFSTITGYNGVLSGLSTTTPTTENIANFLVLSSGTTPSDRFSFDLSSVLVTPPISGTTDTYTFAGTLVDNTGALSSTAASFSVTPNTQTGYSFNIATAAPEPSSLALTVVALLALIGVNLFRRRLA
jgi:hypothetical protein